MAEKESQYQNDIFAAFAERTVKRLWILIILLVVLLFGSNAAWTWYELQWQDVTVMQEVEQDANNGTNNFIGGDFYGAANGENNGEIQS